MWHVKVRALIYFKKIQRMFLNGYEQNKLTLDSDKVTLLTFSKNGTASHFKLIWLELCMSRSHPVNIWVLYWITNYLFHIQKIKTKLGRHCGIVSKVRQYVPTSILLKYYPSNIKPIIQYGLLVYGGTVFYLLNQFFMLERKIVRIIFQEKV